MRLPTRKKEKERQQRHQDDQHMTQGAYNRMQKKVKDLETSLPSLAAEVTRTQEMGDLSENAAYQEAKFTLRRAMGQIERLKERLKNAIIIQKSETDQVQIGSRVTVVVNGAQREFEILGSLESDPSRGRISHNSPIGAALLGHKVGDKVLIKIQDKIHQYEIIELI